MSLLDDVVRRRFPGARVELLSCDDAYRVSIVVKARDLAADKHAAWVDAVRRLSPTRRKRRRLHWGRRK